MANKTRLVIKVFSFVIRQDGEPRLLAMESIAAPGRYEVVRGKVEKSDPSLEFTGRREVYEEAGIEPGALVYVDEIGQNLWQPPNKNNRIEEQHALVFLAPAGLPEQFDHVVQSDAGDNGLLFSYHWLPLSSHLIYQLTEGSDYFVSNLLAWASDSSPTTEE